MRLWKLPSWADPRRALRTLISAAVEGGVASAVKARSRELELDAPEMVELPGFHLFEPPSPVAPYSWLMPQLKGDVSDLINLWECYVDQQLGARTPMTPIESDRFVLGRTAFRRVFGLPRRPSQWFQPAAMIIALAQQVEGQENLSVSVERSKGKFERSAISRLRLHVSGYLLEATPTTLYSNLGARPIEAHRPASDAMLDGLCIRPLRTAHPLARALLENEDTPHTCLQAANVVLRGLSAKRLSAREVRLPDARAGRVAREAAVVDAINHLDREWSLRAVYDRIVPTVISAAEFRQDFGNPFRGTAPRPETVKRWRESLFALAT
ncbi:hypothetical protein H4CHR_02897 [Variovorax sp. PBS-H4]|uniref:hypothetical protein n=1 Tax=Variovorax sp. PBS-H4 TaxID=434008 RepID=UPI00131703A7|nr:hypothetical protein [Variovorax sp. PBS-H4]VTU31878.1 hypothetical protein H4CHR_02897 [Variovorax sp. PBS-H4]